MRISQGDHRTTPAASERSASLISLEVLEPETEGNILHVCQSPLRRAQWRLKNTINDRSWYTATRINLDLAVEYRVSHPTFVFPSSSATLEVAEVSGKGPQVIQYSVKGVSGGGV